MRSILCYGDSNTWGYRPPDGGRYRREQRWTGVLQTELGPEYLVIEEGLNGRTTVWDDPLGECRNGRAYLPLCLDTHHPLDLVLLMLGTNDLKLRFHLPVRDIAAGAGVLVKLVQQSSAGPAGAAPAVLLIAPPPLGKLTAAAETFQGGFEKSLRLAECYREVAGELGCFFRDAGAVVTTSDRDGIHWEAGEHQQFGRWLAREIAALG
jgi:lysophospholipase L1-like esterase